jgi:phage terminase small subunit
MGEVDDGAALTFERVREILLEAGAEPDVATMYAHAWAEYREAQESITKNGAVVANPRTGAPITNPYLKVRDAAEAKLLRLARRARGNPVLWK